MLTYNAFLYTERIKKRFSIRKMAKELQISNFAYRLIEQGYVKPTKKQVQKISDYYGIDFNQYLDKEPSYPAELPDKQMNKIIAAFYKIIGHIAFKITAGALTLISMAFMITGFVGENDVKNHRRSYYNQEYLQFFDDLSENGVPHFSVSDVLLRPEYFTKSSNEEEKTSKYISILGSYEAKDPHLLKFIATYRTEEYRLIYTVSPASLVNDYGKVDVNASVIYYNDYRTASTTFEEKEPNQFVLEDVNFDKDFYYQGDEVYEKYAPILSSKIGEFKNDFTNVIKENDEKTKFDFDGLCKNYLLGTEDMTSKDTAFMLMKYIGIVATGLFAFTVIFSFLYGTYKGKVRDYRPAQLDIPISEEKPMKKDIKFFPFIPETLLEIVGIFLVFIGSFRSVIYVAGLIDGSLGTVIQSGTAQQYMEIFMVGMFLLYFVDFDIFLDDKRVFRNIFLYGIIYVCLYALEVLLVKRLQNGSFLMQFTDLIVIPNMFLSISCYFMIMMFLFYTPKILKKRWQLITYRCLAILPIAVILTTWLISAGNGVFYNTYMPVEVKYLFNGEKIPFSLLAILYLVGLYFLRLFFEKKYGKERARIFFNGNRFLWLKNIMVCLVVVIIGVMEICFSNVPLANKMGLGLYKNILFLIPLLFLYHPHKGPRNPFVDYTTLGLYVFAISFSYLIVAILVVYFIF